jgi:protein-S-isoprenylcysteine O-methyltransferase Ste14
MSLVPEFEIGVWNAWILTLSLFLHVLVLSVIFKGKEKSHEKVPQSQSEKKVDTFRTILLYLMFAYSVFLPLQTGTPWLYTGIGIYLLGIILYTVVMVNWYSSLEGKPVLKGLHRYSRHPQYLTQKIMFVGIGIASASWLFILIVTIYMVFVNIQTNAEERFCLDKYGDSYCDYMKQTPRWFGIPKSDRT